MLNLISVAQEKGLSGEAFDKNAAYCPYIYGTGIQRLPEENFRSSVPKGFDLMREGLLRDHDQSGKSEIGNFDII